MNPLAFQAITAAARAAMPFEACGLLFGAAGRVAEASIARNVSPTPRRRFEIDPSHLFDAHRRARGGGLRLVGCWHSHPGGGPLPSSEDRAGVHDLGWLWLIVADGGVRGFRPAAAGFDEVALHPAAL